MNDQNIGIRTWDMQRQTSSVSCSILKTDVFNVDVFGLKSSSIGCLAFG